MNTNNKNDYLPFSKVKQRLIAGKWHHYFSDLEYNIINNLTIECVLDQFKEEILEKLEIDASFLLQFRICSSDRRVYRNMSTLERYTKSDFSEVYDIYKIYWELQMDEYLDIVEEPRIFIAYNIAPVEIEIEDTIVTKSLRRKNSFSHLKGADLSFNKHVNNKKIKGFSLPNTMDFKKWGEYQIKKVSPSDSDSLLGYTKAIVVKKQSPGIYELDFKDKELNVKFIVNNKEIFSFFDIGYFSCIIYISYINKIIGEKIFIWIYKTFS